MHLKLDLLLQKTESGSDLPDEYLNGNCTVQLLVVYLLLEIYKALIHISILSMRRDVEAYGNARTVTQSIPVKELGQFMSPAVVRMLLTLTPQPCSLKPDSRRNVNLFALILCVDYLFYLCRS